MEFEQENTVMFDNANEEAPLMNESQIEETTVGTHSENNIVKVKKYLLPIASLVYAMLIAISYAYLGHGCGQEKV